MAKVKRLLGIIVILALVISGSALFLVNSWPTAAQDGEEFQLAPLNPDFLEFLQQPYESLYGHIPHTMDLSHLKNIPVQREQALRTLPATFDWRAQGKVTPVRNQNPCGTCWIHGILAAVESRVWIVEDVEYDFSEQNVACCTDPAWVYLIGNRCDGGGWSWLATDVLTKKGTRLESCDPYNTDTINTETCNDACTTIKRVTGFRLVASDPSQITEVKNAVYDYGPVSMAYCHDDLYLYPGNIYYWPDCTEITNHEVCIVGWDDTIAWPGDAGNGVWIVKNSWGTGFGDAGYFYMCYGSGNMEDVVSYRYEDYDANETLYYWDEAGYMANGGYEDTSAWMASVFTSGQYGNLTHVDFWTTSNDAAYEIYVYNDFFGSQLAAEMGSCAELGYYSIPLTTPVSMTNGQQFTVAVKMATPGYDSPLAMEYQEAGYCEPPIQSGVCYTRHQSSDTWEDAVGFASVGVSVCLRARILADTTPPTNPTDVTSDPAASTWSNDNTVEVNWTASVDTGSGLDGYSILWDTTADTLPDDTIDIQEGITSDTSPALADGDSHYFHIRAVDNAGNWQSTVHVGPFFIDKTAPADPTDVTSDPAVNTWSNDDTVTVNWTDSVDAGSGLDGYSILWDITADTLPPVTLNLEDSIETATSAPLADGNSHYFHIRAVDNAGNWQSTVHLGPFFIDTTPPAVTVDIPGYINAANVASVSLTITSNEDGTYSYTISDGTPAHNVAGTGSITGGVPVSLSLDLSGLDEGLVTADASVTDGAGNVGNAPQDTATKDTVAPAAPTSLNAPAYINIANVAAYMATGSAEAGSTVEVRITDGSITVTNTGTATGGAFSIAVDCSTLADGTSNISIDAKATDAAGNASAYSTALTRSKDTVPPGDPTDVTSEPAASTWSNDNTVEVNWTASVDTGSGLDGYSILWDTTSDTLPPATLNLEDTIETATSAPLADGDSHYFHIRSVDNAGNWQSTVHVGPFFIDTIPPAAVTDLAASNPTRTSIDLIWIAPGDDTSGTATYDIRYSTSNITAANWDAATQCTDEPTPSAAGSTETFTVTGLSDNTTYYFALKTDDKVPNWSALSNVASGTTQNSPPVLSNGAVSPTSGYTSTTFTYSVTYTDAENDAPNSPTVSIDGGTPQDMTAQDPGDEDYTDGKVYEYSIVGSDLGTGSHTFQFAASDGIDDATGDTGSHDGPTVSSPPSGGGGGGGGGDTTAPVISNIECSDCTKTSIIIKWRTDEIGTSQVEYWASEHMFSPLDESLVLYHEVKLTNLKPCCVYHFRAISKDSSGNEVISEEDTFTTLGTPATFATSGLTISPTEADIGESVIISVVVANTGDAKGTYEVTLWTDEAVVATKEVTLVGGASQTVTFTLAEGVAGSYTVGVNGLTSTFVVRTPAAFTISALAISPAQIDIGEDITISALVTNTGDLTGTYEV